MNSPDECTIEVTTIGPGFGECTVIHLGSNRWMVVDSCIDSKTGQPAALSYFQSIGVHPDAVELIVATHWHDDHVRGLSNLLEHCTEATFCISSILTQSEFLSFVQIHTKKSDNDKSTSGTKEMSAILNQLPGRKKKPKKAMADKTLLLIDGSELAHGNTVEVKSLSPTDEEHDRFLASLIKHMPNYGETKYRAPRLSENDTSVVLWVKIGDHCILLGADLEETRGAWTAIVDSDCRPHTHRASVFKIPHHGSITGHHQRVWDEMLIPNPLCLLTPYNRGSKLPQKRDVDRILSSASNSFSTKQISLTPKSIRRDREKEKLISFTGKKISIINNDPGKITAHLEAPWKGDWKITLSDGACHLSKVHT